MTPQGLTEPRLRPWPPAMAVGMRVTARCDQAVREAAELAARRRPATGELAVLEAVTLADLAAGRLPDAVRALTWGVAGA